MSKYEVQIYKDKRWITEEIYDDESGATTAARRHAKSGQVDGARVVNDRVGPDGLHREKVVFEEMVREVSQQPLRITPIDDVPLCQAAEDLYRLESRMAMGRLIKKYLEQQFVIPSELLYCYSPLSRFQDMDAMLLPAAVDRVVTLHCRMTPDLDPKQRRDDIYRWIDEIGRRSRRNEGEKLLWRLELSEFRKVLAAVGKCAFVHDEQEALLRHVIARECYKERNFLGKLEILLNCLTDDLSRDVLLILDGFIADVLAVSQVVQELLGSRPNLSSALIGLLDLIDGKPDSTGVQAEPDTIKVLRRLFQEGRLPAGLTVLLDRVTRELGGRQPLSRNDPTKEHEAFCALVLRLVGREGVVGGAAVAGALTRRYALRLEQGGQVGWRMSIEGVSNLLRDNARRMHYLIAVAQAGDGDQHMTAVSEEIVQVVKLAADIHHFVDARLSTTEKLRIVTSIQRALDASCLPEVLRTRVIGRLDDLLARYLIDNEVVERLDAPGDPLRMRALRLVKFCGSGVLMEGKALSIARMRVLHHLRQPSFVENFTLDIAEPDRDAAVRDFYRLLAEAGFST
ncbi:hypothetical protein [Pararhodospirillum photometricum]|uniref:Uncharacterized protein n=1 Tax=Pararhodospirillum photometricum DSM 122 TaxID=1150469 RepID=H6SKN0_PARPM|nr:hypothetical protein [Pararhodospirillum photometricum]CCG08545.1 Putative uncharacterized protein [Pararhodospirillum photometricum DSM 122]